jgi:hypothetical protein
MNSKDPIKPNDMIQTINKINPKIGMKLITSTILNGFDKERALIVAKIQEFA